MSGVVYGSAIEEAIEVLKRRLDAEGIDPLTGNVVPSGEHVTASTDVMRSRAQWALSGRAGTAWSRDALALDVLDLLAELEYVTGVLDARGGPNGE